MPAPETVGGDAGFRPEHKMLPSVPIEVESQPWKASQRNKDLAFPPFIPESVEATEWHPEQPFEDPEGLPVLPEILNPDIIEWKRPSELGLGELPIWSRIHQDPDAEPAEPPDPVIAKPPKRKSHGQLLEVHCKALSNPLSADHSFMYNAITALSVSRYILQGVGQDLWDSIYPKNDRGQAEYNKDGMYTVRMFLLGQWRAVTIDDRLPCVQNECVLPRTTIKSELWPLLIVKALLKALTMTETGEEGESKTVMLEQPAKERFCFMVTCLTGWHPERCELEPCDVWETLKARMAKGNVCPAVWGNHPQERMRYISSLKAEEQFDDAHWDAQANAAFYIKADFTRDDGEVEIQIPKLSWHLPPRGAQLQSTHAGEDDAAKQEGASEEEEGGGEEGEDAVAEKKPQQTMFLKPPVDFKYYCAVDVFTRTFSEFVFFHNPRGYAHQASLDLPLTASAQGEEEPKTDLGPAGLAVDNSSEEATDVLLCFSSSVHACPLLITRLHLDSWRGPARAGCTPVMQMYVTTSSAALLRVPPGRHHFRITAPRGVQAGVQASADVRVELGGEHAVLHDAGVLVADEYGKGPADLAGGMDQLWLRRTVTFDSPVTAQLDLFLSLPTLAPFIQLAVVHLLSGTPLFSHDGRIGPIHLHGEYNIIARSYIPDLPADFVLPDEGIDWQLRLLTSESASTQPLECTSAHDSNGYYVDNLPMELFRLSITPPEQEESPPLSVFAVLRTHSPAVVSLQLLELPPGMHAWSTDNVDPVSGRSTESAERDGVITHEAMRASVGVCVAEILEATIAYKPEGACTYVLVGRLVRREPLVLKRKKVAGGEEGEGGGESGEDVSVAESKVSEASEFVANEIEEPGKDPFWSLRVFTTSPAEEVISASTSKFERMDEYLAAARDGESRAQFLESLMPPPPPEEDDAETSPPNDETQGDAPEGGQADPQAEVWPPLKTAEQSWEEYLSEYRTKCKPAPMVVKRDPARKGVPSKEVVSPEEYAQLEEQMERQVQEAKEKWQALSAARDEQKALREQMLEERRQALLEKTKERIEKKLTAGDDNVLGRRSQLIRAMKDCDLFVQQLIEAMSKIEMKVEDVEGADPPTQMVVLTDQETLEKLLLSMEQSSQDEWDSCITTLKDAGYLEWGEAVPSIADTMSFSGEKALFYVRKEIKRVTDLNQAEAERIRLEMEEAAKEGDE